LFSFSLFLIVYQPMYPLLLLWQLSKPKIPGNGIESFGQWIMFVMMTGCGCRSSNIVQCSIYSSQQKRLLFKLSTFL